MRVLPWILLAFVIAGAGAAIYLQRTEAERKAREHAEALANAAGKAPDPTAARTKSDGQVEARTKTNISRE